LGSAQFVENGAWSGAQIATQLRMNTVTGIWCADLPFPAIARATMEHFNNEELQFDRGSLATLSSVAVAGTIAHELMHNRGFRHILNPAGSTLHPLTVPEQVEACIENFAPNTVPSVPRWALLPGKAKDIGIGADGSAWVIGMNPVGAGTNFGIYRWDGGAWVGVDGGAARIAVGPDGQPWVVNSFGQTFQRMGGAWTHVPGLAKDIGVGADGSVWKIGTTPVGNGSDFGVAWWNGSDWEDVAGGGVRIAVGPDGQPWVVNSAGGIYRRRVDGAWLQTPGLGRDIGVGADGSAWLIGTNPVGGAQDFGVPRWNGSSWVGVDGGGVAISTGPLGDPWLLNSSGAIFHRI
jgi:hypothetical protein